MSFILPPPPAPGVTAHGALTGLGDNDHPQYGMDLGTPTHPWSLDPTGIVGRRVYDASNNLIWTLLANDSGGLVWQLSMSSLYVAGNGTTNEDIQVFDGTPTLIGTIPSGAPLAASLQAMFNGSGLGTYVFYNGSDLYIWQADSASQANPILPSPYTSLYSLYGTSSLASVLVGANSAGSLWRSQRAVNGFANPPSWAFCGYNDVTLAATLSMYPPGSYGFGSVDGIFANLSGNDFGVPAASTDQLIYGGMIPKTFRIAWSVSLKNNMGGGGDVGGGIGLNGSSTPIQGSVSLTQLLTSSHTQIGAECIATLNPGDYIQFLASSGASPITLDAVATSITVTEV